MQFEEDEIRQSDEDPEFTGNTADAAEPEEEFADDDDTLVVDDDDGVVEDDEEETDATADL